MKFSSARHGAGLVLAVAGFLAPSHPARAQVVPFSCSADFVCTGVPVPPGTGLLSWPQTPNPVTVTTDVPVSVAPPGALFNFNSALNFGVYGLDGANRTNSDGGDGIPAGSLTFTNSGAVIQTLPTNATLSSQFYAIYMLSQGGDGGNYTNDDTNHSAGRAATSGAVTVSNSGTIQVVTATSPAGNPALFFGGAALFAESIAGDGGNVRARSNLDSNGNPQYGSQNGTPGAAAGNVVVTNSGTITVAQRTVSHGYWAVAGRSIGGRAGTGNNGQAGGAAGTVTVVNQADVTLAVRFESQTDTPGYMVPEGAFALLALGQGGDGTQSVNSGVNGGSGGNAPGASVTLGDAAGPRRTISLNGGSSAPSLSAAVGALTRGGVGGAGYDESFAGFGGAAGAVSVTASNAVISTTGNTMLGIIARATGGRGGDSGKGQDDSRAQAGGDAGAPSQSSNAAAITLTDVSVVTRGISSAALTAQALGGDGGTGLDFSQSIGLVSTGAPGGNGGNSGPVLVSVTGGAIETRSANSPGISAMALGGRGGDGGKVATIGEGSSGAGGDGGQGSPVTVRIQGGTTIATYGEITDTGNGAFGIFALSRGGDGGMGGPVNVDLGGDIGDGGPGGAGRTVTITLEAGSSITTVGANAVGVFGLSIGGAGGAGSMENSSGGIATNPGNGGAGGDSGDVVITVAGSIGTTGASAHGVLGQSTTGISGDGGRGAGIFHSPGGSAGESGTVGTVTITNTGSIDTAGDSAIGIQAQAIGGNTGDGGGTDGAFSGLGGTALAGADGGTVNVTNSGRIGTRGQNAIAILAQSIGGGGGNGGDSSQVFRSVGGSGGGGGAGGTAQVTLDAGTIVTTGKLAHAVVAQSIGGGGGNAGDATATGVLVTVTTGGIGGDGGAGGTVTATLTGPGAAAGLVNVGTFGSNAAGVVAQSIGGGGGTGGAGYSTTASSVLAVAVAVGGDGGKGGAGGTATVTLSGATISTGQGTVAGVNTNPVDAYGIVAQSIGGGGGVGGAAAALALTFTPPTTEEGNTYSAAFAYAVGGNGSDGGAGGSVTLNLAADSSVVTQGQGSHGVILQSIGGGGGAGGDSSAMAATIAYGRTTVAGGNVFSTEISAAVGGTGQSGGSGGIVTVTIDAATIVTFGDYANALVAQSVGGGGGNGGIGSATTTAVGSTRDVNAAIQVGGLGGTGGGGGLISATIGADAVLQTYGSSAHGVVAQGIGGGGGTSQGGGVNFGGDRGVGDGVGSVTPVGRLSLQTGATGGAGGSGGTLFINMGGSVATAGADAVGVTLQAIGGGGGLSGGAGGDASSDNPVAILTRLREAASGVFESNFNFYVTASLTVGGTGGVGGRGGRIDYTQSGSVTTLGDWATGVMAQSIGGGGGRAGVASANSSGLGISSIIALGSKGGSGGEGSGVSLIFDPGSAITTGSRTASGTTGYAAFGVLAQSIGGGGGVGADGSIASQGSLFLGGTGTGSGGGGGAGNTVGASGTTRITTFGDNAPAMVLQSIGGGGGLAGTGSTLSGGFGRVAGSLSIKVGGSNGSSGDGGSVGMTLTPTIATTGANSFGILAQSIGGGGGFGFSSNLMTGLTNSVGATANPGQAVGNGGSVRVTLNAGGSIVTQGFGAHGIVAQSIGGGGGIAGLPDPTAGTPTLVTLPYGATTSGFAPGGAGGSVTVTAASPITTSGAFAHGIFAQAIGGGGGLFVSGTQVNAGTTVNANLSSSGGSPGSVTINVDAPITVRGENASGVFAQAQGTPTGYGASGPGYIRISVDSAVQGGSGAQGRGVWVETPNPNGEIRVGPDGSVSALSGVAIQARNGRVINYGTITGSYDIGNGTMYNYGTLNPGPEMTASLLVNEGTMVVGAHARHGTSRVSGDLVQTATGRMVIEADFANRRSDQLVVAGSATLDGRVVPVAAAVLPNVALPFMTVAGATTGTLEAENSPIFGYQVSRSGNVFSIAATSADFTPAGFALSDSQVAVADHLQGVWNAGGSAEIAPLFALLGNTAQAGGAGAYGEQLRDLSPGATFAPGARGFAGAMAFANAALSCPSFEGTTAMLVEGQCAWGRITGRTATQDSNGGLSRFTIDTTTVQLGGQVELDGGWLIGGSLAYESSRLSTGDRVSRGTGEAGYGAITLKYQDGPWLFSGAAFGGYGDYDNSRTISLPGFGAVAKSSPEVSSAGVLLRGAYTIGAEAIYVRPSMTLSGAHVRSGGYQETGAGPLNLDVSSASATIATLTPAVEIGGRIALDGGMALRLFVNGGVSFASTDGWTQDSRLANAPAGAGSFTTRVAMDPVMGRVTVGAQLFATERYEFRLQYDGEYGSTLTGHGGSFAVALRF